MWWSAGEYTYEDMIIKTIKGTFIKDNETSELHTEAYSKRNYYLISKFQKLMI